MKMRNVLLIFGMIGIMTGCVSVISAESEDVVVRSTVQVTTEDPALDKRGAFFLRRSMLCRQAFSAAMTNLVAETGRTEDSLRGATICGIDEGYTNGIYTLQLDVAWSNVREAAAGRVVAVTNNIIMAGYVPSIDERQGLANWIGPKQVRDQDGSIHFLGVSAMAVGRNSALSQQNIRRAELDAQALAVRALLGPEKKISEVKAEFREVFSLRSRHPLCPDREMYACGYEAVALDFSKE